MSNIYINVFIKNITMLSNYIGRSLTAAQRRQFMFKQRLPVFSLQIRIVESVS